MTNEQIDAMRPEFEAWARKKHAYSKYYVMGFSYINNEYREPETQAEWSAWQAARELPAGVEPVAWLASYQDREGNEASYTTTRHALAIENDANGDPRALFAAPQILAMGRVPPGFVAVPDEPVTGQSRFAGEKEWSGCHASHVRMVLAAPHEWEGYEVRYLYAQAPAAGKEST